MVGQIHIEAKDVWKRFWQEMPALKETMLHMAEDNTTDNIEIYLTEDDGMPQIIVFVNDKQIEDHTVGNPVECEDVTQSIYDAYITTEESLITTREDELNEILYDFLWQITNDMDFVESNRIDVDDIKEDLLEHLARNHGIPVYRPMYLVDENGEEFFEEFPYEHMVFDDEDEDSE